LPALWEQCLHLNRPGLAGKAAFQAKHISAAGGGPLVILVPVQWESPHRASGCGCYVSPPMGIFGPATVGQGRPCPGRGAA